MPNPPNDMWEPEDLVTLDGRPVSAEMHHAPGGGKGPAGARLHDGLDGIPPFDPPPAAPAGHKVDPVDHGYVDPLDPYEEPLDGYAEEAIEAEPADDEAAEENAARLGSMKGRRPGEATAGKKSGKMGTYISYGIFALVGCGALYMVYARFLAPRAPASTAPLVNTASSAAIPQSLPRMPQARPTAAPPMVITGGPVQPGGAPLPSAPPVAAVPQPPPLTLPATSPQAPPLQMPQMAAQMPQQVPVQLPQMPAQMPQMPSSSQPTQPPAGMNAVNAANGPSGVPGPAALDAPAPPLPDPANTVNTLTTKEVEGLKQEVASLKGTVDNLTHTLAAETAARQAAEKKAEAVSPAAAAPAAPHPGKVAPAAKPAGHRGHSGHHPHSSGASLASRLNRDALTRRQLVLLSAMPGEAVVQNGDGIVTLHVGDVAEGWGKVTGIGQAAGGQWTVTTDHGVAAQEGGR